MQQGFTGRHMLYTMLGFFGVIITVNAIMATFAGMSWTGLLVANTYVESQKFNSRIAAREEQAARQWRGQLELVGGAPRYQLVDSSGAPIGVESVTATFTRPTHEHEDQVQRLTSAGDGWYVGQRVTAPGVWTIRVESVTREGTRDTRDFRVTIGG